MLAVPLPQVLAVNPSVPAKTVKDLVAVIRANPGKYNFASPGSGTQPHLVGELFRLSLSLDLVHVPFAGGGPAAASVIAGHTPIYIGSPLPVVQQANDGKLVALAATSKTRAPALPEVPPMTEAGYPEVARQTCIGMFLPPGTPQYIAPFPKPQLTGTIPL